MCVFHIFPPSLNWFLHWVTFIHIWSDRTPPQVRFIAIARDQKLMMLWLNCNVSTS